MEKHIYLVRHGETESNADGLLRGPASMLTTTGRKQAEIVAERIGRINIEALVASPYPRALETARTISNKIGLVVEECPLFIEWKQPSAIINRHRNDKEVQEINRAIFDGLPVPGYRHSDEETFDALKKRANDALDFLVKHPSRRICIVTHQIFLQVIFGAVLMGEDFSGRDLQRISDRIAVGNTSVSYIRYADTVGFDGRAAGWEIISWNDLAHFG